MERIQTIELSVKLLLLKMEFGRKGLNYLVAQEFIDLTFWTTILAIFNFFCPLFAHVFL